MGGICIKRKTSSLYREEHFERDEIKITDIAELQSIKFEFTNQRVIHMTADLLVLFMDHTTDAKRNDHFTKFQVEGRRLEEHGNAYIKKNKLNELYTNRQLPFITFDIMIPYLNYKKISMIFCNAWKQETHNDTQFRKVISLYFQSIKEESIKSIVIAQFPSNIGVHLQRGVKRLMRQIVKMPKKPQLIQFCCLSEQSKNVYMESMNEHRQDLIKSFNSTMLSTQSDYF